MQLQIFILFGSTLVNLGLGVIVWMSGTRDQIKRTFIAFSGAISLWSFGLAMFYLNGDPFVELFWARLLYAGGSLIALTLAYFSFVFPSIYINIKTFRIIRIILVISSLVIFILTTDTNLIISKSLDEVIKSLAFGKGYLIWAADFIILMTLSFINLFIQFNRSKNVQRLQVKYILIGTLSAAVFGTFTNLILPTLGNFTYFSVGPLLTIIMAGLIAYAIVKHRLMDVKLVVARAVAYSFVILIIGILYAGLALTISNVLFKYYIRTNQLLIYISLTLLVALSFQKLREFVEKVTDRIFFKGEYNTQQLLSEVGRITGSSIELYVLTDQVLRVLLTEIRIERGTFVILEGQSVYDVISIGYRVKPAYDYKSLLPILIKKHDLIFDELEEGAEKQLLRDFNLSVIKVLQIKDDTVGLILLGEKSSGEMYSEKDLNSIDILAPEVAIAIQNARSFDKIKKFNLTLSEEVKRATTDLQQANQRLRELDRLKDDFVSVASHELRTPMTAIKSYLWMAIHHPDIKLSDKMIKYITRAYISTERLINLVNDMLNVSRIEAGRIEIRPAKFDILKLVEEVVLEIGIKAKEKHIKITVAKTQLPEIFADPDKVHQVLLNLLGNALKFTPSEGLILISFFTDGKQVETAVKDSGVGISKEDMSQLFQKFGRLDNSYVASATSGGTGLGLFISKSLIDLMKGRIWVSSAGANKGTTFTFSLPAATADVLKDAKDYSREVAGEAKVLESVAI